MLEHNDLTQDEQMYPELTKQLQENYPLNDTDQQSLHRIRARIHQTSMASLQQNTHQGNMRVGQFIHPPVPSHWHTNSRRWRIGLLAALLLIALVASTFISLKIHNLTISGKPAIEQPKNTPVIPVQNQVVFRITMKSATTGWGEAGSTADGSAPHQILVRTIDGGKTWSDVQLPAPYTTYVFPFFLDETTAWVIPGSSLDISGTPLIRTIDGGRSWQKFTIPGQTDEITFVDRQNGWATDVVQKGQNAFNQDLAAFHTADGGKTWQLVSKAQANTITGATPGPFPNGEVGHATFLNPLTGWFVRGSVIVAGHGSFHSALYMTLDGGQHWQLQQLPQSDEIIPSPNTDTGDKILPDISLPRFFDAQHGILRVLVRDPQNIHMYVYSTDDTGQTWHLTGNKFSQSIKNNPSSPIIVTLINTTHILLAQKNEIDLYELVGGQWQKKYHTTLKEPSINNDVNFINEQTGWFVADAGTVVDKKTNDQMTTSFIYMTNDGGKSWQKIQQSSYVVLANSFRG